jgi:hypothetical protein
MKVRALLSETVDSCRSDSNLLTYSLNCIGLAQCSFNAYDSDRYTMVPKHHGHFAAYTDFSSDMVTKSLSSLIVAIVSCLLQNTSLESFYSVADAGW